MESDQRIQEAVKTAYLRGKEVTGKGAVATYIPELGKARPEAVGLCIHTKDGKVFKAGDSGIRFTMQSVSKLVSLAMALEIRGYDTVFEHVGMEPSGAMPTGSNTSSSR
ncbi:MAG: glutaminase, partial [Firmicutes bacterium]|nr:glutaminase [Bacillota bacterium]